MSKELAKTYDPKGIEDRIYQNWLDKKYFHAEVDRSKKPFTIVMPPPNVTGQLHMGHALDNTMQDILIRYKRMQGYNALWQPGTDHAAIATEVKVIQKLKEQGIDKNDIGREEFLKHAWEWKEEYGGRIVNQLKKLGSSADWDRERFTMDEGCSKAVEEVFVKLYNKGYIYKGSRIINWCPVCKTSISDAEVEHVDQDGFFWHINYPIVGEEGRFVEIATTRPETLLGDTAVAVNPEDERYQDLIGKMLKLPLTDREIPVIADSYVDKEFGTGCVKITPAHDPNDFEVGKRHNLPEINIMNDDATINELGGKYAGMDRYEARKAMVADLDALGLLVKVVPHTHSVGTHDRCKTTVEPMIKPQWFVKMQEMAKPAIEALKKNELNFVPDRFDKIYLHWLENIRDWCISRQLWWGHRIPAYYCDECGEVVVAKEMPKVCPKCGCTHFKQDEDTLDTWFSSALWPFSTLGWPDKTEDFDYFYPTDVLVTGYDIIFFWVIRMVFSAIEQTGKVPFHHVLIHGLVRDSQGRKMSKSLGNGIDPLEIIDQYGADALRLTLITGNAPGNDMRFYMERVEASRNFANKVWNASRFIMMNLEKAEVPGEMPKDQLTAADKWILSKVNTLAKEVTENMDKYELGIAVQKVYDFIWEEFCDWYIEMVKPRLYNDGDTTKSAALWTLKTVLVNALKLLHPYMPFITEEIFCTLQSEEESIMISRWPEFTEEWHFAEDEAAVEMIKEAVRGIRNVRTGMNVPPSKKAKVFVVSESENVRNTFENGKVFFATLGSASEVTVQADRSGIDEDAVSAVLPEAVIYMPFAELVDIDKEIERLQKEEQRLTKELARVNGMLSNERFMSKAPESKVAEERAKLEKYSQMMDQVKERLTHLQAR
ncbi:valine--tRNA ligase [Faecalicatena fissicatena]|uniref:Valine--tRNA ligase n=1 Tax=Faecalicatena fissicatena TaxID=290055 RepID=A0ABX2GZ85_9FIRM|nr:valine--tRNA ligase [Faecalicatena fissicatena]CDA64606.1 valine--tRNA ligase [Firmicutes bacterium CAG:56]MCB5867563.1 valine--tRNA ligase [Faecalicatena fissicatena]NSD82596.1 valine--tRNA ligase [Faecalicatena fissicatena]NSE55202.1 valine--tRNA ligase [Faecalicatena fissicatena]NSE63898.1 valine--tRNA ligase [Faecalicatena fissicatena]